MLSSSPFSFGTGRRAAAIVLGDGVRELLAMLMLVALALLLARDGPAMPGLWSVAAWLRLPYLPLAGLAFSGGIGLIAYALARASQAPRLRGERAAETALPAMLAGLLLLPGLGALGLAAPLAVCLTAGSGYRRLAPLLAITLALAYLDANGNGLLAALAAAAVVAGLLRCWCKTTGIAANDNPSLERIVTIFRGCECHNAMLGPQKGIRITGIGE